MIINMGGAGGKKTANGQVTSSASGTIKTFTQLNGSNNSMTYFEINTPIGFIPSLIIINYKVNDERHFMIAYKKEGWTKSSRSTILSMDTYPSYFQNGGASRVDANGFCLPCGSYPNAVAEWYAYE